MSPGAGTPKSLKKVSGTVREVSGESPESVGRVFLECSGTFWRLFGVPGPEAPGDIFETLSAFRARRARETSVRGGLVPLGMRAISEQTKRRGWFHSLVARIVRVELLAICHLALHAVASQARLRGNFNRYTKRPLQDSAIICSTPGMAESAFYCANHRVSCKCQQPPGWKIHGFFRWKMPFAVFRSGSGVSEDCSESPNRRH